MDKTDSRPIINYLQKKRIRANEIDADMISIVSSYATVKKWAMEMTPSLKISTTNAKADVLHPLVLVKRDILVQQIAKPLGISSGSVCIIFN